MLSIKKFGISEIINTCTTSLFGYIKEH